MATFYWTTDQPLRAEKCWWDIFRLRDPTDRAHCIEEEVWHKLATPLSQTSGIISDTFQSRHSDLFLPLNLKTPFPPVHAMIKSEYASSAAHKNSGSETSSDITVSPNIHSAITGGAGNLSEIVQKIPDTDLATRDILGRTPLFMAAFLKQDDAGHALMTRIEQLPPVTKSQYMNSRDVTCQTILGVATQSGCSVGSLEALIKHGAEIDPDILAKDPLTPLQAACLTGSLEAVDLFLR
jgi:hypothetical protein